MDQQFKTYLFSYRHEGHQWGLEIRARDPQDAKERLKALAFARYDGELVAKFPAGTGFLVKAIVWMRNVLQPT